MRADMRAFPVAVLVVAVASATATCSEMVSVAGLEAEMTALVDRIGQSVVSVAAYSEAGGGFHRGGYAARTVGCGIIFDAEGLILTTASVVGTAGTVEIGLGGDRKLEGEVLGRDPGSDLAVVRVEDEDLKAAAFSRGTEPLPGSLVLVLGNAFGVLPSVTMGMVSSVVPAARSPEGESMIRISAPINPGDIGGPVIDTRGEVVGILIGRISFHSQMGSLRISDRTTIRVGSQLEASNMSVAVPAERALEAANRIVREGDRPRGFLGIKVVDLSGDPEESIGEVGESGVMITEVVHGSPAESIGLAPGDIITLFGGDPVESVTSLRQAVVDTRPGDLVRIGYTRDSAPVENRVRIASFMPEYVRQASFVRRRLEPDEVKARIEQLKAEIEALKSQVRELEEYQAGR
jgi:S1-C subfamily serine protease